MYPNPHTHTHSILFAERVFAAAALTVEGWGGGEFGSLEEEKVEQRFGIWDCSVGCVVWVGLCGCMGVWVGEKEEEEEEKEEKVVLGAVSMFYFACLLAYLLIYLRTYVRTLKHSKIRNIPESIMRPCSSGRWRSHLSMY